jgi:hypothetical protein
VRDEVVQGLIGAGLAEPRPHRFDRFAATVAQQALDIAAQRAALRAMAEAIFEQLQPREQSTQPRGRGVIEHRPVA